MTEQPPLRPRPKLHRWLDDRGLGATYLGERWGITPQGASRYLLPFDDARRIIPTPERMEDVIKMTRGEVGAADWYPSHLSGAPLPASIGELPCEDVQ